MIPVLLMFGNILELPRVFKQRLIYHFIQTKHFKRQIFQYSINFSMFWTSYVFGHCVFGHSLFCWQIRSTIYFSNLLFFCAVLPCCYPPYFSCSAHVSVHGWQVPVSGRWHVSVSWPDVWRHLWLPGQGRRNNVLYVHTFHIHILLCYYQHIVL